MSELQQKILSLSPDEKLALIAFITEALREEQMLVVAKNRQNAVTNGTSKVLTLEEVKTRSLS
ncbi:MAG: hypothetical protein AAF399_26505 [Bacteroidota bacterium]